MKKHKIIAGLLAAIFGLIGFLIVFSMSGGFGGGPILIPDGRPMYFTRDLINNLILWFSGLFLLALSVFMFLKLNDSRKDNEQISVENRDGLLEVGARKKNNLIYVLVGAFLFLIAILGGIISFMGAPFLAMGIMGALGMVDMNGEMEGVLPNVLSWLVMLLPLLFCFSVVFYAIRIIRRKRFF